MQVLVYLNCPRAIEVLRGGGWNTKLQHVLILVLAQKPLVSKCHMRRTVRGSSSYGYGLGAPEHLASGFREGTLLESPF
jgi:hypothetical protein